MPSAPKSSKPLPTLSRSASGCSSILDSKERIPYVSKHGAWCYNFWRDEKNVRGLWRRTSLAEFKKPQPAWEIVLDLDKLAAAEKENWVWKGDQRSVSDLRPLPGLAVARRCGCHRDPRVRPQDQGVRHQRLLSARSQEPGGLAQPGHALRRDRFRPGLAHRLRLPAHRQGVEARHTARRRRRWCSRASPRM